MEGFIPMVFKAIKRNKVRRQYRCLSVGATQTYNLADFYDIAEQHHNQDHNHDQRGEFYAPRSERRGEFEGRRSGHRRFGSAGEYGSNVGYNFKYDHDDGNGVGRISTSPSKQIIKRYRSHRMFSCITGTI
ncbi:hypothetical protein BVRB_3g059370 [Beta vulgaris subsp. vulgaris]|nr:hypothetical protein BVRB_3g059370 [Beta vulgaris subsp. vulgaris]